MASSVMELIHSRFTGFWHPDSWYTYMKISCPSRPASVAQTTSVIRGSFINRLTISNCRLRVSLTRSWKLSGSMGRVSSRHPFQASV